MMHKIDTSVASIKEFQCAIESKKSVICNKKGEWKIQGALSRFIYWLFRLNDRRLANIALVFASCISKLENQPVYFKPSSLIATPLTAINELFISLQNEKFKAIVDTTKTITELLSKTASRLKRNACSLLTREKVALQYRIGAENHGLDTAHESNLSMLNTLKTLAFEWKKNNESFPLDQKRLTDKQVHILTEASRCEEFAKLINSNEETRNDFFNWTLRDNLPPQAFIEYPSNYRMLKRSHLPQRLGRFAGTALSVHTSISKKFEGGLQKKVLRLRFIDLPKPVTLFKKEKSFILKNNWKINIAQVMEIFRQKSFQIGNLEFFEGGVANWNGYELGSWNPHKINPKTKKTGDYERVDLTKKDFWKEFPVFSTLTAEQVKEKYRLKELPAQDQMLLVVKASRRHNQLDVLQSHGWTTPLIPTEDGKFLELPNGVYPATNPQGCLEKTFFVGKTNIANNTFPDENEFFTNRQNASVVYALDRNKEERYIENMREIFQRSSEENLILQFAAKTNCAGNTQSIVEEVLGSGNNPLKAPNLFGMNIMDTRPSGIFGKIFEIFRMFPKSSQPKLIRGLTFILGGRRTVYTNENGKQIPHSLNRTPFLKTQEIFVPSKLHQDIQDGKYTNGPHLSAFLSYGHPNV
jgi:hypothetical protein